MDGYYGLAAIEEDVSKNYAQASEYYNRALKGTEQLYVSHTMYSIGQMYDCGRGEFSPAKAIEWYKKTSAELKAENGGKPVPSLMFQHIPMLETFELVEECNAEDEGAVKGPDNKFIRLKPDVEGFLGEYISAVEKKTGQMEAIKECGDVKAVVFGHDHQNCFTGAVDGIDFIQTSCASFRCYGNRKRGVRVFDIDEATGDYETFFLTYEDIVGKSLWNEFCYIWDADDMWKKKVALIAGSVLGATAIGVGLGLLLK